jgi:hypothetical protein
MTVKELIDLLRTFDPTHRVIIEADYDCGYGVAGGDVSGVTYERGVCIIKSEE